MPYFLETDTFHADPAWEVLAGGSAELVDRLQSALTRLKSQSAHILSWGYLTEGMALQLCRGRQKILELLCTPVLGEKPMVHRQGDDCECLGDTWTTGYAYRIHNFSKRNPSKREYNRNRAQKAELRDARLKAMVYNRDGGCCRYCTSGPLSPKAGRSKDRRKVLHYDHVDPDQTAGPDGSGLVVACGRCNEGKGKRTPEEADMVLLPPPSPELAIQMRQRPLQLFDSPPADHQPNTDEPPTKHRTTDQKQKPDGDPITDPNTDHQLEPTTDQRTHARPHTAPSPTDTAPEQPSEPSGLGRGGPPDLIRQPHRHAHQEPRTPEEPDVYTRRSRAEPPRYISADPEWPTHWPAGSVPATPPHQDTSTGGTA